MSMIMRKKLLMFLSLFIIASSWAWAEDTGTSGGGTTVTTNVAKIGTTEYATIQDAFNACEKNAANVTTITLIADVDEGASFGFPDSWRGSGRKIVLDLNEKTYKFKTPAMGSTGYESQAMHLINGNELTVKNGTLAINPETTVIKRLIQNYCDLTLENVTVDTESVPSIFSTYNNSFCRGTVILKGNTVFKASPNAIVFDIDGSYCSGSNGGDVEFVIDNSFTGSISGKIEYVASSHANNTSKLTDNANYLKAKINNDYFATVGEAISYAQDGATIELLADVKTESQIEVAGKEVVLDLKGHKIEYTGSTSLSSGVLLVHNGAGLTIKGQEDGSEINAGTNAYAALAVTKKGDDATNPAKLTIESGKISGYYYAITGNGGRHNTEITINGGTITATCLNDNLAIFHPQDGILTINGGEITGYASAIEMRAGKLNITNGTFNSTATTTTVSANGSGNTTVGAAIAIAQHTTKKAIDVNISGGNFSGCTGLTVFDPQNNNDAEHVKVTISGGTINATSNGINAKYGTVNISGGTIEGQTNFGVAVDKCTVNISGTANITSQEFTVGTGYGTGAIVNISGGTLTARDNAVIGGNGNKTDKNNAERVNPNKFNISGGTFNGKIQSSGYVACGIYAPWKDEFNITGGTFNITGGAGIVARAGMVNVSGNVTITCSGNVTGKVGDSRVVVPCSPIVFDSEANYPAMTDASMITVTGGTFTSEGKEDSPVVKAVLKSNESNKRIVLLGGTYSSEPGVSYLGTGTKATQSDSKYTVAFSADEAKGVTTVVDEENIEVSSGGTSLSETNKTQAVEAIKEVVNNTAVTSSETNANDAVSTESTTGEGKTIVDLLKDAVTDSDVAGNIQSSNITTSISVTVKSAEVETSGSEVTVTKMVFEIKPVATVVVNSKPVASVVVPNELITQKIKFRLPVSKTNKVYVEIFHKADGATEAESLGCFPVQIEGEYYFVELERDNFSTYEVVLSEAESMDVYYVASGSNTNAKIAMDKTTWNNFLAEYPNAVAIVNKIYSAFAEGNKNVLVEYPNDGTKTYVCPIFELTDLKDFYTPVDFIAKTGEYSRTPNCKKEGLENVKFNSVCLPFELNNGDLSETAQLLSFTSYNKSYVYFNTKDKIEAGVPCLVYEDTNDWNTIRFNNTNIVASPITSTNIQGTFATRSDWANSNDYYSVNKENKFSKLYNTLSAFRSCLYLKFTTPVGGSTKAAQTRGLGIVIDGNEQGTTDIDFIDAEVEQDNGNVYNLNGQKMNGKDLERGFYIKNNKKIFVK